MSDTPGGREQERQLNAARRLGEKLVGYTGLRATQKSLCHSCSHGVVFSRKGPDKDNLADAIIFCGEVNREMPPDIMECSSYSQRGQMSLYEMTEIALLVDKRVAVKDGSYL